MKLSSEYAAKHGLTLDTRLSLRDLGVSGFTGKNITKGALGAFLKAVESGKVKRGSLLLVEALDRISRAEISEQMTLFLNLINAGIEIVTLADGMRYSRKGINENMQGLMYSIMLMSRGHEESATKSRRLKAAWSAKRESGKPLTSRCPAWLILKPTKDEFERVESRCRLLKRIFTMVESGLGKDVIARTLNREKQPVWGRGNGWHASYVQKILTNRSVLGEYQHHKMVDGKRVPIGAPIQNYFPKVISEALFHAAVKRSIANGRVKGRRSASVSNLFTGLLKCGYTGTPIIYSNKGEWQYLVSDTARRGLGGYYASWPYADFETSFLAFLTELRFEELFDDDWQEQQRDGEQLIAETRDKLASLAQQVGRLTAAIEQEAVAPKSIVARIVEVEDEQARLTAHLEQLERKHVESATISRASGERRKELKELVQDRDKLEVRIRLQQHIREHVQKIELFGLGRPHALPNLEDRIFNDPDNDPSDEERIRRLKNTGVISSGRDARKQLAEFDEMLRTVPTGNKRERYFKVTFVAGGAKLVMPEFENPEKFVRVVRAEPKADGAPLRLKVKTPKWSEEWRDDKPL